MENKTYEELKELVEPHLKCYKTDLTTHDKEFIERNPDTPFIHMTHETGTYLTDLTPFHHYPLPGVKVPYLFGTVERRHILDQKSSTVNYCISGGGFPTLCCLYFDGKSLRKVTLQEAKDIVIQYQIKMRELFVKGN